MHLSCHASDRGSGRSRVLPIVARASMAAWASAARDIGYLSPMSGRADRRSRRRRRRPPGGGSGLVGPAPVRMVDGDVGAERRGLRQLMWAAGYGYHGPGPRPAGQLDQQAAAAAGGGAHQHPVAWADGGRPDQGDGGSPVGDEGDSGAGRQLPGHREGLGAVDDHLIGIAAEPAGGHDPPAEGGRVDPGPTAVIVPSTPLSSTTGGSGRGPGRGERPARTCVSTKVMPAATVSIRTWPGPRRRAGDLHHVQHARRS